MYLKSIEVHGFKSFANKILFQFHNGITGIVGPNGSGKSNVADAVRWVLGEQSAKQLRGSSMQDVIFSGTEARKPLGFASVSITLDNSDHQLAVAYDEVTVTRRVYRSGESEYLMNGTTVRLRDINELFYDTGIGKEGYSIIGQGQIEKILNGKPDERRELFDEAAGIVKFKRRKITAQKKLEAERQNLVRVNDILSELTRQLAPLERQAETAKIYLQKRDELKKYDVNLFLFDFERLGKELQQHQEKQQIAMDQLEETKAEYEKTKQNYEILESELEQLDITLQQKRDEISHGKLNRQQLENQIQLLREQINTAKASDEHLQTRVQAIEDQIKKHKEEEKESLKLLDQLNLQMKNTVSLAEETAAKEELLQDEISELSRNIDQGKSVIIGILNQRASVKAKIQRYDTMIEQAQIRKSQLSKEALKLKSEEAVHEEVLNEIKQNYDEINERIKEVQQKSDDTERRHTELQKEIQDASKRLEQEQTNYHKEASKLESLRNIAERYDGYGNSIRRVMEQKDNNPGILGVVADIIKVEKTYETAIETALGGSIQNIVTDTEETAKKQIEFLKLNKYGRATFLPLSAVAGKGSFNSPQALKENGVIGLASTLVKTEKQYEELVHSLLGKTIVVDQIDHAISLARKYKQSLRIVTIDGELLNPGGAMTGGAFKNSSNLLGRRREIEELEKRTDARRMVLIQLQRSMEKMRSQRSVLRNDLSVLRDELQALYLQQNTAQMRLEELNEKTGTTSSGYKKILAETEELDHQIDEITESKKEEQEQLSLSIEDEKRIERQIEEFQDQLDQSREKEKQAQTSAQNVNIKLTEMKQQEAFQLQTLERVKQECLQLAQEKELYILEIAQTSSNVGEKELQIKEIQSTILEAEKEQEQQSQEIADLVTIREEKNAIHKKFFANREELSERMNLLDRETFRLNAQIEKMTEQKDNQVNYMWEEYGLTYGAAKELQTEELSSPSVLKKHISQLKNEIRALGNVNVNAIEDYKELSERHQFLSTQHEDLLKAENALLKIIEELDNGMRTQFKEQFVRIQAEFDKAFKELFGGGRGTLELVEEEDILEAGIRIVAQPPGKKLVNMMQMSGGEKSLTAIALLFAIQNLKPSPFCLLDEIEAALDENNVDRYANYLHKLTKNTQFIIITHRRGTMNAADRLYGITMQEKGVSALVSVNLIQDELDA